MSGPSYHAQTHEKGGTDEIAGLDGIRFDVDNEGGWLYVVANDSTDISFGEWGVVVDDESSQGILIRSSTLIALDAPTIELSGAVVGIDGGGP